MICFELPSRYCAALARGFPGGNLCFSAAIAEHVRTLPEPLKGVLELGRVYNASCFLDLKPPGSADELDMTVWLSEDRAARWRAALRIVSEKLSPVPSAILYLHGVMARQMLDTGFSEVLSTRDSFSDMLVLNILCLDHGGVDSFMRWISTSGGLGEFIEEFAGLRGSILMSHREMLVHHNEAEAFSYAVAAGIPHFA